jgi:hypothetical protein
MVLMVFSSNESVWCMLIILISREEACASVVSGCVVTYLQVKARLRGCLLKQIINREEEGACA